MTPKKTYAVYMKKEEVHQYFLPKSLVRLATSILVLCFATGPIGTCIPTRQNSRRAEKDVRASQEALALPLSSARHPFNKAKSRVAKALRRFRDWPGPEVAWIPQMGLVHAVAASPAASAQLRSFLFFAAQREGKSESQSRIEYRALTLLRKFLSDPGHGDEYGEEFTQLVDEEAQYDIQIALSLGRMALRWALPRVQVSVSRAIAILDNGSGKGAVVKLPLGLEDLKAVLNSPAERAFALFLVGTERFLLVYPGSAGKGEYGPLMSFPAISGSEFNQFADALGHSHPRFTNAEPSEPDLFRALDTDTFILAFVDRETIEVTLWRANETDYRTERGHEALNFLMYLGLLAQKKPKTGSLSSRAA